MTNYYIYLISSFPSLHFGEKPPFSYERFLLSCRDFILEEEHELLTALPGIADRSREAPHRGILRRWLEFDTALRNELAKARAALRRVDPHRYTRPTTYDGPSLAHLAVNARRNTSILDAERSLDETRWRALDDMAFGHYFDFEALVAYALKLLILQRWERIRSADRSAVVEAVLPKVTGPLHA